MASKRFQLESYRKALLNRVTANAAFTEYIENTLTREDESAKHSFHKIMIHNWSGTDVQLFDTISEYFMTTVIPVQYSSNSEISSFYTSSLGLMLKMIRLDFMFPFQRNMFNIDILFNDKTSRDCFNNTVTLEDIVCGIVSRRLSEKMELNLSNFCSDPEFQDKKISFYKISLLAHFKILMLRMGRDTMTLNLSSNNLSTVPLEILNFFIKGDLTAINLSDNEIPSLQELLRVSSRIEKLWLEGNPLCEELDAADYVKVITMKFPRLIELDGVKINEHGCIFPFFKNYLVSTDRRTKMIVEKFLTIYFTNYDCTPRNRIETLYAPTASLTINISFPEQLEKQLPRYVSHSRNMMSAYCRSVLRRTPLATLYHKRGAAPQVLGRLPPCSHDPGTFTVDVLMHTNKAMILVVDGIYRELNTAEVVDSQPSSQYIYFSFRKTFVLKINQKRTNCEYLIFHEMFSVRPANQEQIDFSFKRPQRNLNELTLIDPDEEETDSIIKAFMHITNLKRSEAEARLKLQEWDIRKALKMFMPEFRDNKISLDKMIEEDDFSDTSSLVDDEID